MGSNQLAISGTKYEIKVTYTTEQEFIESSFKEQKCAALSQRGTLSSLSQGFCFFLKIV